MWDEVVTKLAHLKALDPQFQVFGSDRHRYELEPTLPEEMTCQFEDWLEVAIPGQLRSFYRDVGNGVAGPHYGLLEAEMVEGYRPSEPYTDAVTLRALARDRGNEYDSENYFEVERDDLTGLITIIEEGCGHEICLVTTGARVGEVVHVSIDGHVNEMNRTLIQTYDLWLDPEIEKFETVKRMMSNGSSFDEIKSQVREKFDTLDADDVVASIANAEKPGELFGTGFTRIYGGEDQMLWYENVLREWQTINVPR